MGGTGLPGPPGVGRALPPAGAARRAHRPRLGSGPGWPRRCRSALVARHTSTADGGETLKWLWGGKAGGASVETVLMRYPDRATVCVSTQAGCAMGCTFCATGQAGFERHLTTGEIVEQVVRAQHDNPAPGVEGGGSQPGDGRVSNVVFMGMGEPLANYDATWAAVSASTTTSGSRPATSPCRPSASSPACGASPPSACRSRWPCRSTPPTTPCATSSCPSTAATRSPTCWPRPPVSGRLGAGGSASSTP